MGSKLLRAVSLSSVIYFVEDAIVSIQTPTADHKPYGWADHVAAVVLLKGNHTVVVEHSQWGQLKKQLGIADLPGDCKTGGGDA